MAKATAWGMTITVPVRPAIRSSFHVFFARGNQAKNGRNVDSIYIEFRFKENTLIAPDFTTGTAVGPLAVYQFIFSGGITSRLIQSR
jgi:hypothetical protein